MKRSRATTVLWRISLNGRSHSFAIWNRRLNLCTKLLLWMHFRLLVISLFMKYYSGENIMKWHHQVLIWIRIETLLAFVKIISNGGCKEYSSKVDLLEAIKTPLSEIGIVEVNEKHWQNQCIMNRLLTVIKMGNYIKMKRIQRISTSVCFCSMKSVD